MDPKLERNRIETAYATIRKISSSHDQRNNNYLLICRAVSQGQMRSSTIMSRIYSTGKIATKSEYLTTIADRK
ncbi:hypothetical protein KIN20_035044 [Parelaphostrongylus tenuis]|uniref:Uncharacterized protein n=1 Tax=Parelaphostrongylus tenuis TaxID=148309 RepID=A0AAD5WJM7_PARTN|nr:hypothetical protein KIN20_035044 [Parelaphostrongylus tenuis]